MGTLVAVRKNAEIVIAADGWNLMEGVLQPSLNHPTSCIVRHGDSYIGLQSSYAYQQAFEMSLATLGSRAQQTLSNRNDIFKLFVSIHDTMKGNFQLAMPYQQNQIFEISPMNALVVNQSGIYKIDSTRAVYEFNRFWALGSAETFALGALHAAYDRETSAAELARIALKTCAEFEASMGREITLHSVKSPGLRIAAKTLRDTADIIRPDAKRRKVVAHRRPPKGKD